MSFLNNFWFVLLNIHCDFASQTVFSFPTWQTDGSFLLCLRASPLNFEEKLQSEINPEDKLIAIRNL